MIVSHDPMAAAYADRVLALRDGRLSTIGPPSRPPSHPRARRWTADSGRCGRARRLRRCGVAVKPLNALHLYRVRLRARLVAGVLCDRGHRRRGRAAVRLAGRELEPAELGQPALARDRRQRDAAAAGARPARLSRRASLARVRAIPGVRVAAPVLEAGANAIGPRGSGVGRADRRRCEPVPAGRRARARDANSGRSGGSARSCCPRRWRTTIGVRKFGQEVVFQLAGHTGEAPLYSQLAREPDRAADRQRGGDRAAVVRPGNDGPGRTREPHPRAAAPPAPRARVERALQRARRRAPERRGDRLRRRAVRQGGRGEQPVDRAVRGDQRARGIPVRVQRDAAHRPAAPAAGRRSAPRRVHAGDRDRGAAARRRRARPARHACSGWRWARSSRSTCCTPTRRSCRWRSRVGSERVVSWQSVAFATAGGMLAAIVAVLTPLRDILSRDPLAAIGRRESAGKAAPGRLRRADARARAARRWPGWRVSARRTADPARRARRGDPRDGAARRGAAAGAAARAQRHARARPSARAD